MTIRPMLGFCIILFLSGGHLAKLFKRCEYWHYDFRFQKQRYQGSTFLKNKEKAESYVARFRSDLALGLVGLTHHEPAPILKTFLEGPFLTDVQQNCKAARTKRFYAEKVKVLCDYAASRITRLDAINEQWVNAFKAGRLSRGLAVDTINGEIRTLRKALKYAESCDLIRYRKIKELPGAKNRTYVLDAETERRYLELAGYPLRDIAILMLDLGLRPEEAVSLTKSSIRDNDVTVVGGKTENARRVLPQTSRTKAVFALCFALFPTFEWVFPGSKGKHFTRGAISNMHTALRKAHQFPREFVVYSLRHTFATRLAESCNGDLFVLMKALGHADTKMCLRYVHTTPDYLSLALRRKEAMDRMLRGEDPHEAISTIERKTH